LYGYRYGFIWVNPTMGVSISGDSFVCYEACAGLLATPTGGSGGFAYQWSPAIGLSSTTTDTTQACGLTASQNYTVLLTDALGCTATDSFAVTVNPQLVAHAQLASLACFADTIQLSGSATGGSPAYSYRWDSTGVTFSTQQNLQLLGLTQSQTVVLTITDQQGCSDVDSLFIPLNSPITVDLGPDSLLCYGDSLQLNPAISGGSTPYASYTWRPASFLSDPSIRNPIIQNIIQTTPYILQVVDNTGCDALDTVTYTVNPQLIAHAGPDQLFCFGDSVQIGGSPTRFGRNCALPVPMAARGRPERRHIGQSHRAGHKQPQELQPHGHRCGGLCRFRYRAGGGKSRAQRGGRALGIRFVMAMQLS
jgi:hypothetical protein